MMVVLMLTMLLMMTMIATMVIMMEERQRSHRHAYGDVMMKMVLTLTMMFMMTMFVRDGGEKPGLKSDDDDYGDDYAIFSKHAHGIVW